MNHGDNLFYSDYKGGKMPYGLLIFTLTTVHIRCRQFIIVDNHWEHNLVVTCIVNASPLFPVPIPPDLIEGGYDETWHYSFCPDWENINTKIEREGVKAASFVGDVYLREKHISHQNMQELQLQGRDYYSSYQLHSEVYN